MRSLAVLVLLAACGGGEPANVAGNYTVAVTNRDNGCAFQNWTVGNSASGIPVTITQSDTDVTASVEGLTGGFLALALGDRSFRGEVSGSHLSLDLIGTTSYTMGNCTYTFNALLDARVEGDTLMGQIVYTAATNDQSDCATLEGCESVQDFNGTRPPT